MESIVEHSPCLILNQDYTPLRIADWKEAISDAIIGAEILGEGINIIEWYEDEFVIGANGMEYDLPAVAVTAKYIKRPRVISLRKRNLMVRDNGQCQYCGCHLTREHATIDHVIPRCKFPNKADAHTWENTVIACKSCNSRKDDKTLKEAGMKLLNNPYEPEPGHFYTGMKLNRKIPKEWSLYVPA